MSQLLEILGRAITVNTSELIWHWLNLVINPEDDGQYRNLNKAVELMGDKKIETAAEHLRIYLFDKPDCIFGRMTAAAICIENNNLNEAITELNAVYTRKPNNTMALYALGNCYERLGKEDQAKAFYQDCIKFKKYLKLPAQRLGAIYFKNGRLAKATEQYQLLVEEYPEDISTLIILGHLYVAQGNYKKGAETFNNAILMHPDNFPIKYSQVDSLIAEGHLYDAMDTIEDLLHQYPDRPDLLIKQADIYRMLGSTNEAVSHYQQAIRICPDFLEATIKLGTQYLHLHEDLLAAEQFNKAVEMNDKIVDAYIGLSISQLFDGDEPSALDTLSLASAIQPNSSLLFAETAALHYKLGLMNNYPPEHDECSMALTEAVIKAHRDQLHSRAQNPDLYYRLGILLMNIGRLNEAAELFKTVITANPLYSRARNKLVVCLFQSGKKTEALKYLSDFYCLDKKTLELHYKTALLYCDKVKFTSSLLNLDRLLETNYTSPDTVINISIILQNLGLLDRSSAMWDNISETVSRAIEPDYPF